MSLDDRIAPRIDIDATLFIEAGVRATPQDTGDIVICKTRDVSESGMQLIMDNPIRKGRIVRACLDISPHEPVYVIARVVWQNRREQDYYHGLVLISASESDTQGWKDTVENLA